MDSEIRKKIEEKANKAISKHSAKIASWNSDWIEKWNEGYFTGFEDASLLSNDEAGMGWVKASERLPEENKEICFRWDDDKHKFVSSIKAIRDENGNIPGLIRLEWLDQSPSQPKEQPLTPDDSGLSINLKKYSQKGYLEKRVKELFDQKKIKGFSNTFFEYENSVAELLMVEINEATLTPAPMSQVDTRDFDKLYDVFCSYYKDDGSHDAELKAVLIELIAGYKAKQEPAVDWDAMLPEYREAIKNHPVDGTTAIWLFTWIQEKVKAQFKSRPEFKELKTNSGVGYSEQQMKAAIAIAWGTNPFLPNPEEEIIQPLTKNG